MVRTWMLRGERIMGAHRTDDGVRGGVWGWLRQTFCGLHGHDAFLQFGRDRLYLKCVSCGHESPGWNLGAAAAVPESQSVVGRSRSLVRPHLVDVRRVA